MTVDIELKPFFWNVLRRCWDIQDQATHSTPQYSESRDEQDGNVVVIVCGGGSCLMSVQSFLSDETRDLSFSTLPFWTVE